MGDAGVGKTRLVRELWERPGRTSRPSRCAARAAASRTAAAITYWPLGEILKEHFGILESDRPEEMRRPARRERGRSGSRSGWTSPATLHPLAARERLHDAWVDLPRGARQRAAGGRARSRTCTGRRTDLLDLLERVHGEARGPLLLLGTARPEFLERRPTWGGGPPSGGDLARAALAAADAQVAGRAPRRRAAARSCATLVVERAEGNPFFVEELLATLIDRGVLCARTAAGRLAIASPPTSRVPDSVQAVLAARIDLLPPLEKAALQAAAVIGRVFWHGPVVELLGGDEPDFGLLEERDFVRRRPGRRSRASAST